MVVRTATVRRRVRDSLSVMVVLVVASMLFFGADVRPARAVSSAATPSVSGRVHASGVGRPVLCGSQSTGGHHVALPRSAQHPKAVPDPASDQAEKVAPARGQQAVSRADAGCVGPPYSARAP